MVLPPVCRLSVLAVVAFSLFSSHAAGQAAKGETTDRDRQTFLYVTLVLGSPDVQEDLALTDDQLAALADIKGTLPTAGMRIQDRRLVFAEVKEMIADTLTAEQAKRHKQIYLQCLRVGALLLSEVVEALELTAEQQERVRAIDLEGKQKAKALRSQIDLPPTERKAKGRKLLKEIMAQAMNELTPSQREAFQAMIGPAYEPRRPDSPGKTDNAERAAATGGK